MTVGISSLLSFGIIVRGEDGNNSDVRCLHQKVTVCDSD